MAKKKEVLTLEEKLENALVPVEEQPYEVPDNWVWTRLESICFPITDGTHNTPTYSDKENGVPFISSKDVTGEVINWSNIKYITKDLHEKLYARVAPQKDDVLLAKNGTTGVAAIVEVDKVFDIYVTLALLRTKPNTAIPRYLLQIINSPVSKKQFNEHLTGIGVPNLHLRDIRQLAIPLPPLPEQTRIVSRIESLFSKLDEARELIESSLNRFEERKSAILHKAFSGELTQQWREENGQAKWNITGIEDLVLNTKNALKAGPFGSSLKKSFYVEKGYKVYGQEQVIAGNETIGDYYISEDKYKELNSCKVAPFDILISLVGTVGKVLVLSSDCKSGIINPRLIKVTLNRDLMIPHFFKYYFESDYLKKQYSRETHGSTMEVLNMKILKKLPFPLPTLPEQEEIVRILDNILGKESEAKELLNLLEKIDLMKKAILGRAFRGELGTNREDEESAEGLLREVLAQS